jgi:hypothetical protein
MFEEAKKKGLKTRTIMRNFLEDQRKLQRRPRE